jgi:hypothetical protein
MKTQLKYLVLTLSLFNFANAMQAVIGQEEKKVPQFAPQYVVQEALVYSKRIPAALHESEMNIKKVSSSCQNGGILDNLKVIASASLNILKVSTAYSQDNTDSFSASYAAPIAGAGLFTAVAVNGFYNAANGADYVTAAAMSSLALKYMHDAFMRFTIKPQFFKKKIN